jgi:Domain of unknown function (DUF4115)
VPVPSTRTERLLAGLGAIVLLALTGLLVPAWLDYRSSEPASAGTTAVRAVPATVTSAVAETDVVPTETEPVEAVATTSAGATTAAREQVTLELTAARGDCWLVVRRGSADGPTLSIGILDAGATRTFTGSQLWVEVGAPAVLDATLNGDPVRDLPASPATLLVTPAGVREVSA